VGTEAGYFSPTLGRGTDRAFPSTELLFTDTEAPGLAAQPDFLHTTMFAEVDYRDQRGNPRSGGYYKAAYGIWDDRNLQQYDFGRFDGEAAQFVPIATKAHVIASRVGVSYANNAPDDRVPFTSCRTGGSYAGSQEFRLPMRTRLLECRAPRRPSHWTRALRRRQGAHDWDQIN
jgi:hypothetical protein